MKNAMAEKADDLVREENGSKGTTTQCQARSGHTLGNDELWPASMEGKRALPCIYL